MPCVLRARLCGENSFEVTATFKLPLKLVSLLLLKKLGTMPFFDFR